MKAFNNDPAEYSGAREFTSAEESVSFAGNPTAVESNDGEKKKPKRKKGGGIGNLTTLFVAATVVVAAGAVMLSSGDAEAKIVSATATDTEVSYEVVISSEDALEVILYNDFTRRSYPLEDGSNVGVFKDLHAGVEYTVAVVGDFGFGETKLAEKTIKTAEEPPYIPVSEWYGVETECRCAFDHCFYFKMDFIDEKGIYSDFEATLTDAYGNVSACVFGENLHDWQRIDVNGKANLLGKRAVFRLTYHSSEQEDPIIFEQEVKI